jgi:hypothetical protein
MHGLPLGDPSRPAMSTAADRFPLQRAQPNSGPLGQYTGAPAPTRLLTAVIPPSAAGQPAVCIVPPTRENRFVTLVAPAVAFVIYVGATEAVSASLGIALPGGIPYELTLPGEQGIFAASNAPVNLEVSIQIASAVAGDLERNLGR